MARRYLRDELHAQLVASVRDGAKLLAGWNPIDGPGAMGVSWAIWGCTNSPTSRRSGQKYDGVVLARSGKYHIEFPSLEVGVSCFETPVYSSESTRSM